MGEESSTSERVAFLKLVFLFQGGLILLAAALSWCLGQPLMTRYRIAVDGIGWGLLATIPMLGFLVLVYQIRARSLIRIRELLRDTLGRSLAACHGLDLCVVALLAGVSEEYLFRGILEPWLSGWDRTTGFILSNCLFGLCHAVTPTYALLAALMGAYLSSTLFWTNEPNLFIPIFCHSLYDLIAFVVVRRSFHTGGTQQLVAGIGED